MTEDRVSAIVHRSAAFAAAAAAVAAIERAWLTSHARRLVVMPATDRVRFWSVVALAASATGIGVMPLATTPRPLAWLLPAVAAVIAFAMIVLSPRR